MNRAYIRKKALLISQSAVIAALYVALTFIFAPISFGAVQFRVAEALTILPVFTPAGVQGLFLGCLIGNLVSGAALPDVIFGSLATLIGAYLTRVFRKRHPAVAVLPPILSNSIIIPFILCYAYGVNMPIPLLMLTVGLGEIVSCGVFGVMLYYILRPYRNILFKKVDEKER